MTTDDSAFWQTRMAAALGITTKAAKADAARAERILRTPGVSHRDMVCALYSIIWDSETLDEVRNAVAGVSHPCFYQCEFDRCVTDDIQELWPESTSVYADLANALRGLGNDHA
jgi:hypothetical protein